MKPTSDTDHPKNFYSAGLQLKIVARRKEAKSPKTYYADNFAYDACFAISDKNITDLECKVNKELIKINKLSLNNSKSCYIINRVN